VLLENGEIKAIGNHESLMKDSGFTKRSSTLSLAAYARRM
jgi:hypothetical protein